MAEKYLIHGATYNGDGTSSAEASSNGAAGAWNTINYLIDGTAPAYGTLAAGDNVNIRSKTSGGADITVTLAASKTIGNANGTQASPITWTLDNGAVWSGVDGKLTIECPSSYTVGVRAENAICARTALNWVIKETNAAANNKFYLGASSARIFCDGIDFDFSAATGSGFGVYVSIGNTSDYAFRRCRFTFANLSNYGAFSWSYVNRTLFDGCDFVLNTSPYSGASVKLFAFNSTTNNIEIVGGSISGATAAAPRALVEISGSSNGAFDIVANNCRIPTSLPLGRPTTRGNSVAANSVDGAVGSIGVDGTLEWSSRIDAFFPYLNAQYPTSTPAGWSWWLSPYAADKLAEARLPLSKLYTDTAATKTITLEILVANTYPSVNKSTFWINVVYQDSETGLMKSLTTRDFLATPLDESTAAWSATSYGGVGLLKRKFSVTTPTPIKKDSVVSVNLCIGRKADVAGDIVFACPDFSIT